jgi:hypothetical protein
MMNFKALLNTGTMFSVGMTLAVAGAQAQTTKMVSVNSDGMTQSSLHSYHSRMSADGQVIAFDSCNETTKDGPYSNQGTSFPDYQSSGDSGIPSTLVTDYFNFTTDWNIRCDVFVHERITGLTEIVCVGNDSVPSNLDGSVVRLANGNSSVSGDGRFALFETRGSLANLNGITDDNNRTDIYLRDRENDTTELISVSNSGGLRSQNLRRTRPA